jgi:hypothetical protein
VKKALRMLDDMRSPQLAAEAFGEKLDALFAQFAQYRSSPEAPSLPRNLLTELETSFARARQSLEQAAQRHAAIAAHDRAYSAWEADPDAVPDMDALRRELRSLPVLDAEDARLFEQRCVGLQARISKAAPAAPVEPVKVDMSAYRRTLEALEQALEEGALQLASEHEKQLREAHALKWGSGEAARLAKARAELSRLKGWARWGGKVSREELVTTAEELPASEVNLSELAKKIGTLRSQWKSMDAASGAADKETWIRFDAACTAAYAPVAAHFSALAAERKANQEYAQALLAQIREFISLEIRPADSNDVDWRKAAAFRSRMLPAWREIGPIDRRAKKELDKQFAMEMAVLSGPLADAQQEEMKQREELIAQATQLDPAEKSSMAALRELQQRWQQHAKSLPLERQDEQALWLRFRAACGDYIARRNVGLRQIDVQYTENFGLKTALCERLESEADKPAGKIGGILNDAARQWNAIGPVPRAQERTVEERFQKAISALRSQLDGERQAARRKKLECLREKLMLCLTAEEAAVAHGQKSVPVLEEQWRLCESLVDTFERALQARFHAALTALRADDAAYATTLDDNRAELERDLLRLEIGLGLESPPQWAGERLKLQVDALQASMKSGGHSTDHMVMLRKICALPATTDSSSRTRIERVLARLADSAGGELQEMA